MAIVLIQEDNNELALLLGKALKAQGHKYHIFRDTTQTLAFLHSNQVDLIVADIFVRDEEGTKPQGGIKLLGHFQQARLRSQPLGKIPVLAISGALEGSPRQIDVLQLASDMGAKATLRKPFSIKVFLETIQSLL